MLSSQTAPYSLLEIMAGSAPAEAPAAQVAAAPPGAEVLVSIARGYARFNGTRVEMTNLRPAIEAYMQAGYQRAVVTTAGNATVQDVVSVLEVLEGSGLAEMRLVTQVTVP
jgi:biopolymer transport protein ExbD